MLLANTIANMGAATTKTVVDKIAASKRQLDTAIWLWFNHGDIVSIHTLTDAAFGIVLDLYHVRRWKPPIPFDDEPPGGSHGPTVCDDACVDLGIDAPQTIEPFAGYLGQVRIKRLIVICGEDQRGRDVFALGVLAWMQEDEAAVLERARTVARQEHIYLQVALDVILRTEQHPYAQNRVLLIDPAGTIVWDYYKTVHPFGDNAIFAPGPGVIPVADTPFGRLATVICFDADYPALLQQVGQAGADVFLVPSHDWAAVKHMHAQVAVFRAIENGVAVVRPTGDGISLATDYLGRVLATADDFVTVKPAMVVDTPKQGMVTIYAKVGDLFIYLCAAGWIVLVIAAMWRRSVARVALSEQPVNL
jgi:hypothetical protein